VSQTKYHSANLRQLVCSARETHSGGAGQSYRLDVMLGAAVLALPASGSRMKRGSPQRRVVRPDRCEFQQSRIRFSKSRFRNTSPFRMTAVGLHVIEQTGNSLASDKFISKDALLVQAFG
jgi:hypothetical protein